MDRLVLPGQWATKPPAGVQLNRSHALARGLTRCWLFNEGGGAAVHELVSGHDTIALAGSPPWTNVGGMLGVQFQASASQKGTFSWTPPTQQYCIEVWLRPTGTSSVGEGVFFDSTNNNGILWRPDSSNKMDWSNTSGVHDDLSTAAAPLNAWTHAVVAQPASGASFQWYINGVQDASYAHVNGSLTFTQIGQVNASNLLDGVIGLIRCWERRTLSAADVQALYQAPWAMMLPPRRLYVLNPSSAVTNTLNPGTDTLALSDPLLAALGYSLSEAAPLSDPFMGGAGPALSDGLSLLDLAPSSYPALVLSDPLVLSELSALLPALAGLSDSLSPAEALGVIQRMLAGPDTLMLAEALTAALGPSGSDALLLSEVVLAALVAATVDGLTLLDALAIIAQNAANFIAAIDALTVRDAGTAGQSMMGAELLSLIESVIAGAALSPSETLVVTDALLTAAVLLLSDGLTLADATLASQLLASNESLTLADAVTIANGVLNLITATDTLALTDALSRAQTLAPLDSLTLSEALVQSVTIPVLADALAPADAFVAGLAAALSESLGLGDGFSLALRQSLLESLTLSDLATLSASNPGAVAAKIGLLVETLALSQVFGSATIAQITGSAAIGGPTPSL